jgi:hypothetical protein
MQVRGRPGHRGTTARHRRDEERPASGAPEGQGATGEDRLEAPVPCRSRRRRREVDELTPRRASRRQGPRGTSTTAAAARHGAGTGFALGAAGWHGSRWREPRAIHSARAGAWMQCGRCCTHPPEREAECGSLATLADRGSSEAPVFVLAVAAGVAVRRGRAGQPDSGCSSPGVLTRRRRELEVPARCTVDGATHANAGAVLIHRAEAKPVPAPCLAAHGLSRRLPCSAGAEMRTCRASVIEHARCRRASGCPGRSDEARA